ncbi:MAG: subunit of efflux transporter [Paenibacillaceae bacterium]|nr:subunit of efflux transporter [Paenibacillaceae bacterium]
MKRNLKRIGSGQAARVAMAVAVSALLASGCSAGTGANGAKSVMTAAAATQKLDTSIVQDGKVSASSQVTVVAKVGGDIQSLLKKRGDLVKQGDTIVQLDSTDAMRGEKKAELAKQNLQAQLAKAKDDLATNKAVLGNTIDKLQLQIADMQKSYNNLHNDYDSGLVAKEQLDKADTQLKTAQLDLDTARKQLSNLNSTDPLASLQLQLETADVSLEDIANTLDDFQVKAPISGVLTDLNPEAGMTVAPGYAIGTIQQLDPVKIHADLTENATKLVRGQKEVAFTLVGSEQTMKGKVDYLAEVMSPQSQTFWLDMSIANPDGKLKPGMTVKLQVGGSGQADAVMVPGASIVRDGNDNYVFVVANGVAEKRKVTLGEQVDTNREVLDGVKAGEQVVVAGQQDLQDKDRVTVR